MAKSIIRKRTIVLPLVSNGKSKKPTVVRKPQNVSDRALRKLSVSAFREGRRMRRALAA